MRPINPGFEPGTKHGIFTVVSEVPREERRTPTKRELMIRCNYDVIHARTIDTLGRSPRRLCLICYRKDPNRRHIPRESKKSYW
jgi:hypothetical protein